MSCDNISRGTAWKTHAPVLLISNAHRTRQEKSWQETRQMQSQRGNGVQEALTVLKGYWLHLRGVIVASVLLLSYRFFSFSFLPPLSMVVQMRFSSHQSRTWLLLVVLQLRRHLWLKSHDALCPKQWSGCSVCIFIFFFLFSGFEGLLCCFYNWTVPFKPKNPVSFRESSRVRLVTIQPVLLACPKLFSTVFFSDGSFFRPLLSPHWPAKPCSLSPWINHDSQAWEFGIVMSILGMILFSSGM